jgi:hypothetical protein
VSREVDTLRRRILLATALGLHAHLHVFSALVTAACVWMILVLREPAERRARAAVLATAQCVFVIAVALTATFDVGAYRQMNDSFEWPSLAERAITLPRLVAPGPLWKGLIAISVVAVGAWTARARHRAKTAHRDELALTCCATGFIALAVAAPLHMPGWQYFSPRFLQLAVAFGIALVGIEGVHERGRRAFPIVAMVIALLGLERSRALHASMHEGCSDALSGLKLPIERTRVQLSFTLDPYCGVPADPESSPTPYVSPLQHASALYATSHGGTLPSMFLGSPSIHAFLPRELGPDENLPIPAGEGLPPSIRSDATLRHHALAYVAAHAAFYESFLVFGASPADIDAVLARGFVARWRQQSFLIAEYRGCPIELTVTNPPASGSLEVAYSPWPAADPIWEKRFPLRPERAAEPFEVRLDHTICGDVWVRVIGRSDAAPERPARCVGSGPDGRMVLPARPGLAIRCQLQP